MFKSFRVSLPLMVVGIVCTATMGCGSDSCEEGPACAGAGGNAAGPAGSAGMGGGAEGGEAGVGGFAGTTGTTPDAGSGDGAPDDGAADAAADPNLFLNPVFGDDANACTKSAPCRTLKAAFQLAKSGARIYLESGTYSVSSGEDFATPVPDGVTIEAITAGTAVILGDKSFVGLDFAGSGAVRFVRLEGFGQCVVAESGTLQLHHVKLVGCNTAVLLKSSVKASAHNTDIDGGSNGYDLRGTASLAVTGGSIRNLGPNCLSLNPIYAMDSTSISLESVLVRDNFGSVLLRGSASAHVTDSTFINNGSDGCGRSTHFDSIEQAQLLLTNTNITAGPGNAIMSDAALTNVTGGFVSGTKDSAIDVYGGVYNIVDTQLSGTSYSGISVGGTASGTITSASVSGFTYGVLISENATAIVRSSKITGNMHGVVVGSLTPNAFVNLGNPASLGGNVIQGNQSHGLYVNNSPSVTILAAGNTWNPFVQGANASGQMTSGSQFTSAAANGSNFATSYSTGSKIAF